MPNDETQPQQPELTPEELRYFMTLLEQERGAASGSAATAPGQKRRGLSPGWWAAAVFALVIVAVAAWVLLVNRDATPAPAIPVAGEEQAGDGQTADMGEVRQPSDAEWPELVTPSTRTWLPIFPGIGPENKDGTGWPRTLNGAVAAAWTNANQIVSATAEETRAELALRSSASPEATDRLIQNLLPYFGVADQASPEDRTTLEPAAVKVTSASPDRVDLVFGVVLTKDGNVSTNQSAYSVEWVDGDWKVILAEDGVLGANLGEWVVADTFVAWGPNAEPEASP